MQWPYLPALIVVAADTDVPKDLWGAHSKPSCRASGEGGTVGAGLDPGQALRFPVRMASVRGSPRHSGAQYTAA